MEIWKVKDENFIKKIKGNFFLIFWKINFDSLKIVWRYFFTFDLRHKIFQLVQKIKILKLFQNKSKFFK